MHRNTKPYGFTLLEILVALAVLALALGAAVTASGRYTENVAYLRDKTLAHWVALNVIANQQLLIGSPSSDVSAGSSNMAGRDWGWRSSISNTPDKNVRKIKVEVLDYLDASTVLMSETGFLNTAPAE